MNLTGNKPAPKLLAFFQISKSCCFIPKQNSEIKVMRRNIPLFGEVTARRVILTVVRKNRDVSLWKRGLRLNF